MRRLLLCHMFIILHSQYKCKNVGLKGTEETAGLRVAQSCRTCRQTGAQSGAGLCSHMPMAAMFASATRQQPAWRV